MGSRLEFALGVLNGTVGDYLARTGNGLATPMAFIHHGEPLTLTRAAVAAAYPDATGEISLLVHGVMCNEDIFRFPDGSDYGSKLSTDAAITPVYVRYNSGLNIPDNGRDLSRLLTTLVDVWPVPLKSILAIGYSMGGLVVRSACHVAALENAPWLPWMKRAIYVGTPHRGAPMERAGRVLAKVLGSLDDPYTRLISDIANLRSDGVKDLGDADLTHAQREDRNWMALSDKRHPIPMLPAIKHHLLAGSLSVDRALSLVFGDTVVPLQSATNGHMREVTPQTLPPQHVKILGGISHLGLAHHPHVYQQILAWAQEKP